MEDLLNAIPDFIYLVNAGDGSYVQSALTEWTGQGKLPIIFIGGHHIGICESMFLDFAFFTIDLHYKLLVLSSNSLLFEVKYLF